MILHPPNIPHFLILRGSLGARVILTATAWHLPILLPFSIWPKEGLETLMEFLMRTIINYSLIGKVESESEEAVTVSEAGLITTMPNIYSPATDSIGF